MHSALPDTERPRLGIIVIKEEVVASEELRRLLPEDIAIYTSRVDWPEEDTPEGRRNGERALYEAMRLLVPARPHVVAFACTSGGIFAGPAWHARTLQQFRAWAPGTTVMTAAHAVAYTLRRAGARSVSLATPYTRQINGRLTEFLTAGGFRVVNASQMFPGGEADEAVDAWTLMSSSPAAIAANARNADVPEADAVFISCTGLAAGSVVAPLERELGKPVLTSNLAIARMTMDALGVPAGRPGYGAILSSPAQQVVP